MECIGCKSETDEVCQDGYCRICHKSITWEDCTTRTDLARNMVDSSMRMGYSKEEAVKEAKKQWPNANI